PGSFRLLPFVMTGEGQRQRNQEERDHAGYHEQVRDGDEDESPVQIGRGVVQSQVLLSASAIFGSVSPIDEGAPRLRSPRVRARRPLLEGLRTASPQWSSATPGPRRSPNARPRS